MSQFERTMVVTEEPTANGRSSSDREIFARKPGRVKHGNGTNSNTAILVARRRGRKKVRRQSHGAAWHWRQTDSWYYTLPGTRERVPLFDEDGNRIRGIKNKQSAQLALARVKLGQGWQPEAPPWSWQHSTMRRRTTRLPIRSRA